MELWSRPFQWLSSRKREYIVAKLVMRAMLLRKIPIPFFSLLDFSDFLRDLGWGDLGWEDLDWEDLGWEDLDWFGYKGNISSLNFAALEISIIIHLKYTFKLFKYKV